MCGQPKDAAADATHVIDRVVVTGSYLPDAATVNASPLVTIDRSAITQSGATDVLRLLKSLTPAFGGSGNAGNEIDLQGVGESYVALRNLPTLVLLDGRRMVSSPFSANTAPGTIPTVDLNTIPLAMVERVEVLKDSASTIYGSDAVGGVINIILRQDFQGAEIGARYGSDRHGDYTTKEGWAVGGVAHPGTSIVIGASYFKSTKVSSLERRIALLDPADLVALGQNPAILSAQTSGSFPGRVSNTLIAGSPLAIGAPGYNASIRSLPAKTSPSAAPQSLADLQAAGYYIPISSTPLSKSAGGSATILNTARYGYALIVPNDRRQAFATLKHEIFGSKLEAFGDFEYSRTLNGGSDLAPAPLSGVAPSRLTIPANNPYNLFGVTIGVGGVPNAPGVVTRLDDLGNRSSDNIVDMYRVVGGLRGVINDRWRWEGAIDYARADGRQKYYGAANGAVMNQLLTPLLNANGTAYVYDAKGRPLSVYAVNGKNVPVYDYFAIEGVNAPETIDALRTTLSRTAEIDQTGVDLRVVGKPFTLPAGDASVAFGGESRRESTTSTADQIFNAGLALGLIPINNLPAHSRNTDAAFAELHVPITSPANGVVFAHRLDVTAAARYEHIRPGGTAATPKLGLHWMPWNNDLLLRATYGKGFVAPSIFALFGPPQGSVPTVTLPEGNGQTGSGGATGRVVSGQFIRAVAELSNPALTPAKSESYTYGIVYSPHQLKGLNLSADYYHIKQDKVGGFDYTYIIADLNARGSASAYAPSFRFTDGTSMTSTAPNQVTSSNAGALSVVYNPVGDLWADGLDLAVNYRHASATFGTFGAGADANVLFNFKARSNPASPYLQYARNFTEPLNGRGNSQGVLPGYAVRVHGDYDYGRFHFTTRLSYLPTVTAAGTAFGAPAGAPNVFRADLKPYTIPSYTTVDVEAEWELPDMGARWARQLTLAVGANNLFDRDAPFVPGAGSGASLEGNTVKSTYDIIGRVVFVELRKQF